MLKFRSAYTIEPSLITIYISIYLPVYLSIQLSIHLYVCIYLFIYIFAIPVCRSSSSRARPGCCPGPSTPAPPRTEARTRYWGSAACPCGNSWAPRQTRPGVWRMGWMSERISQWWYLSKKYSLRVGSKFANASVSLDSLVAGIFFNVVCKGIVFRNS